MDAQPAACDLRHFLCASKSRPSPLGQGQGSKEARARSASNWEAGMTESSIINDQELAILCDLMGGWGAQWDGELDGNKRQALGVRP